MDGLQYAFRPAGYQQFPFRGNRQCKEFSSALKNHLAVRPQRESPGAHLPIKTGAEQGPPIRMNCQPAHRAFVPAERLDQLSICRSIDADGLVAAGRNQIFPVRAENHCPGLRHWPNNWRLQPVTARHLQPLNHLSRTASSHHSSIRADCQCRQAAFGRVQCLLQVNFGHFSSAHRR